MNRIIPARNTFAAYLPVCNEGMDTGASQTKDRPAAARVAAPGKKMADNPTSNLPFCHLFGQWHNFSIEKITSF
jgi:hypothetical protein